MDLDGFLRGDNSTVVDASLPDLIGEARNVVGALSFLHGMLQTNNPGRICCHNDLKPANILVYADSESRVGRWKIADFGISIVTEPDDPVADSLAVTVTPDGTPTVHQPPARNPSTYQAPEVCHDNGQIGRKSDVWSMGCILVRILARGISPLELQDLDRSRGLTMEGAEYNDDYFHRGSPARLNPHIDHWLAEMPGRCLPGALPDFWNESSDLLRRMLAINRRERPTAESVFQRLSRIERLADPRSSPFTRSTSGRSGRSTQSSKPTPPTPPPPPPPTLPADGPQPIPVRYVVEAIQSRQMENLENLLSIGCDIEGSWEGDRPLIHAIRAKSIEAVNILHRYKPALDAETHDRHGLTPLAAAAVQGDPELVDRVLEIPASIDGRSQSGITALMLAARQGHQQVVETLLNQGASSGAYSADGWTPWHYAVCGSGTADLIRLFASRRSIDINTPTEKGGETPLLTLVNWYQRGDQWWDKFTALRDTPANVNHPDVSGNTPLSVAVDADRVKLADSLIQWGASVSSATPSKHLSLDMRNLVKRAQRNQGHRRDSILSFSSPRHSFSSTNSPGSRP